MIAGVASWEPGRSVRDRDLRAVVDRLRPSGTLGGVGEGGVGLAGSATVESTPDAWVVADLDLVNTDELRAGRDVSEGALLAALYQAEGPDFVRRLRGAFALALWDRREGRLLLAVDRFGLARLHYATSDGGVVFATRPSALVGGPGPERRVDLTQVYSYLHFGYITSPASVFVGVERLSPGCLLLGRREGARVERYWDMRYDEQPMSASSAADAVYRATERAVAETLTGLSPKDSGTFLSGGTDSSTVTGLMGRLSGERVSAYSIGFHEKAYDELAYAELAAKHFGATHHVRTVTADQAFELLPRLVDAYDEPYANNSAIGTYFCAELARQSGAGWLLAGDGGDEIFGGNERYRLDQIFAQYQRLPPALRRRVVEPLLRRLPGMGLIGRAQRYVTRANVPNPERFYSYRFFFTSAGQDMVADEFRDAVDPAAPFDLIRGHFQRVHARSELNRLLYLDLKLTIGDDDLLKVTRTAELAGLTVRFPLLAPALVDLTGTLPARFKVRGLEKRYLFKRAFRELLPREILAKRKHGFGVPTSFWLRTHRPFRELARETLLSQRARQRGYFRAGAVEDLVDRHAADATLYYGEVIWLLLMLELWQRRHVDDGGRP